MNQALETAMVIYMDDYRMAKAAKVSRVRRDEELLCVNWNPAFGAIALACYQTPQELSPHLPEGLAPIDQAVMDRIHGLATQI
jgi:hypothetical protein